MTEQKAFIQAWRSWLRRPLPTENFRQGRAQAPTYGVELQLDHLVSSISATVDGFMSGKPWEHDRRIGDYLEALQQMEAKLHETIEGEHTEALRAFVASTRSVLHTFLAWLRTRHPA